MIVTGAGKGIGKSIALAAAEYGADLALGSRTVSECEAVAKEYPTKGVRAETWTLDVSKVDSINAFVGQTVVSAFRRINSVINNAGYNTSKPALDYTEKEFNFISEFQTSTSKVSFLCRRPVPAR